MTDSAFDFMVVTADTGSIHVPVIVTAGAVCMFMLVIVTAGTAAAVVMIVTAGAGVFFVFVFAHYFFSSAFGAFTLFSRLSCIQIFFVPFPEEPRMNLSSTEA